MSDRPNRRGSRSGGPTRSKSDLADIVELLLDKGIVINADIAVSVGDAELLGIQLRAAIASFETAAKYGLEFPTGTDTDRIEEIAGATAIDEEEEDDEIDRSQMAEQFMGLHEPPISSSSPAMKSAPISGSQDEGGSEQDEVSDDGEGESNGVAEAVGEAGSALSDDDTYDSSGSEPGVRERPTAPDPAEEGNEEDDAAAVNGSDEATGDTEADAAADDSNATENATTDSKTDDEDSTEEAEEEEK
ncbi:gas vesicle protein GvpA [Halobacteriales archaeon QS_3_64_16]|nr:MAG: gas vesicle protein GvpA [Halobacteriales archaeon QS_3_64_16]